VSNVYTLTPCITPDEIRVLLATIKCLGQNPCPRCLVQKEDIALVGTNANITTHNHHLQTDNDTMRQKVERARKIIFTKGLGVKSNQIEKILKDYSNVPIRVSTFPQCSEPCDIISQNAFLEKMKLVGQDYHQLFVVDLLHKFEIGIWKLVFTHLIRILHASPGGESLVTELNRR
jgi:hypothetical protein